MKKALTSPPRLSDCDREGRSREAPVCRPYSRCDKAQSRVGGATARRGVSGSISGCRMQRLQWASLHPSSCAPPPHGPAPPLSLPTPPHSVRPLLSQIHPPHPLKICYRRLPRKKGKKERERKEKRAVPNVKWRVRVISFVSAATKEGQHNSDQC